MGASFLRVELMGSVVPCGVKLCKHIFQQKFIDATKPAWILVGSGEKSFKRRDTEQGHTAGLPYYAGQIPFASLWCMVRLRGSPIPFASQR
jgi:hypothetical protein